LPKSQPTEARTGFAAEAEERRTSDGPPAPAFFPAFPAQKPPEGGFRRVFN
jgi:hypothetical protein